MELKNCQIKNCDNKYSAKVYCNKHYYQIYRNGKLLTKSRFEKNEFIDCGNYYEIILYSGNGEQIEKTRTKIDKEDIKKSRTLKWCLHNCGYVYNSKAKTFLHQIILGKKKGCEIDHINGDKLDNRKKNLRVATRSQNSMNRKGVKGYSWRKETKKWRVYICINYKTIHLGCFDKKQDAISARIKAEKKYFGEFRYK